MQRQKSTKGICKESSPNTDVNDGEWHTRIHLTEIIIIVIKSMNDPDADLLGSSEMSLILKMIMMI